MKHNVFKSLTILGLCTVGVVRAADATLDAVTAPSDERKLGFSFPGIVKDVAVKEGDTVKAGQVLATQDDEIENAELDRLKNEASSEARVKYYEADFDLKKKVLERKTDPDRVGAFTTSEIEEAQADKIKAERQIDVAGLDHAGDKVKFQQQEIKVQKLQLHSKIDGVVEKIILHGGEYAELNQDKPAIVIVKNDPAWVEIKELKSWQVTKLKLGQPMDVRYPGETDWMQAKIIFISPTTFPGTENQLVRLELPNPQNRATGLSIQVKLPDNLVNNDPARGVANADNNAR